MNVPLQCRCGTVRGFVTEPSHATRGVCYCRDCQAYARFLEREAEMLDSRGGTPIVAVVPRQVHIEQGSDHLTAIAMTARGPYRWYTRCCHTPIGNTPRDAKTPYVGLIGACLGDGASTALRPFGPVRAVLNTDSARGKVRTSPLKNVGGFARILRTMIVGRLTKAATPHPFFDAVTGEPCVPVTTLTPDERSQFLPAT